MTNQKWPNYVESKLPIFARNNLRNLRTGIIYYILLVMLNVKNCRIKSVLNGRFQTLLRESV